MKIRHIWFVILWGIPGSCKSLEQASMSYDFIKDYKKNERVYKGLKPRILFTNQRLNKDLICKKLKLSSEWFDLHYRYWRRPEEWRYCDRKDCWLTAKEGVLHDIHDIDLIVDEGALLFPAKDWDLIPGWMLEFLKEHRHRGIRIRMLTQAYEDILVYARRSAKITLFLEKSRFASRDISASLPPVRYIWGFYTVQRISPMLLGNDPRSVLNMKLSPEEMFERYKKAGLVGGKQLHWISRFKTQLYDTTEKVERYEVKREIEHIQVACTHEGVIMFIKRIN